MKPILSRLVDPDLRVQPVYDPPQPASHVYAVGDIHGCADLVEPMLEALDADIDARDADDAHLVFLGDYIDRGPDSARVLKILRKLEALYPGRVICLMGNHERMMLDFLDTPKKGLRWLRNGGHTTMGSFGLDVAPVTPETPEGALAELRDGLRAALPAGLEHWLRDLPMSWQSGNVWATHAGADPDTAMPDQSEGTLLWGHPRFEAYARNDGQWVLHGHSIVEQASAEAGRIAVDTGAVTGGPLTAAVVMPGGDVTFLSVSPPA